MRHFDGVGASTVRSRLQMLPLAAGAAVAIGSLTGSALGQTWMGGASANFSVNANWLGNSAPALGTLATPVDLNFYSGNAAAVIATNTSGTPWVSNSLSFNNNSVNNFTLAGSAFNNQFELVGAGATLNSNGIGNAVMANNNGAPFGAQLLLGTNITFGGTGVGNLLLAAAAAGTTVAETGGPHSITVSGGAPLRILRNLVLSGANSFSGGLILDGGTVQAGGGFNVNMFGATGSTMTVTANGGTINLANSAGSSALGTLQLNGDLRLIGINNFGLNNSTATAPAIVQGSGNIYINNAGGGLIISSNSNAYSGAVVIDQSEFGLGAASSAGSLTLSSMAFAGGTPMGSLTGAASIDVRAGGSLILKNNTANSVQNGDRISDTAPIRLRTATFELDAPAAANSSSNNYVPTNLTEKIGDVTGAGNNTVYVLNTSTVNVVTTLEAKSLSRGTERGTFSFRSATASSGSTTMGDGSSAQRGRVILDTVIPSTEFIGGGGAGGSQNISILPWAAAATTGTSANGDTFITYGGDGFRPLTSAEYVANNLAPSDSTSNVMLTASQAGPGIGNTDTLNSLLLSKGASTDASVTGTGKLAITSGAVMFAGGFGSATNIQTIATDLDFVTREGIVWQNAFGGGRISGQLFGSGGFTKTGNGNGANFLILTADNSNLTGQFTLNAGYVQYNQDLALPGTGPIVVNGSGVTTSSGPQAGFYWGGSGASSFTRDVAVNTGSVLFKILDKTLTTQVSQGDITVSGTISGVGNVILQPQAAPLTGQIWLTNPANTYTGTTYFGSGNIHLAADGSTGVGGGWEMAGGTVIAEANITNSRAINFEGTSTIDTKANNVTLNGPITSFSSGWGSIGSTVGLNKNGTGTLTLSSLTNTLAGNVNVNSGTLLINGNLGPSDTAKVMVFNGATLGGSGTIYRNIWGYGRTGAGTTTLPFVYSSGTVAPGSNGPGILTVSGSFDLGSPKTGSSTVTAATSASTLSMELNGPLAGSGYDQIQTFMQNATSAPQVLLGDGSSTWAANLSLSLGYAPSASDVFWLIVNSNKYQDNLGTANTTTGTFASLPQGSTVTLGTFGGNTYTGTISYTGDYDSSNPAASAGNDVVIYNIVPAPGSVALLGIGGLLAARRKRRTA
jgi:autotransporter-associated beta strand protein